MRLIDRCCIASLILMLLLCGQLFAASAPPTNDTRGPDFWVFPMGGFEWPTWVHHGAQLDAPISFVNNGDSAVVFALTPVEEIGPAGWLALPPALQGTIVLPSDSDLLSTIGMNVGGIVNAPGTVVYLKGHLVIDHGTPPEDPYIYDIECWVADTLHLPSFDTVTTGCFSLVVGNAGNFGNQGAGHVNLDYIDYGDCDDLEGAEDTIPGDATVYLYDASPVICWPDGDSVICNWSIFGQGFTSDNGFIPIGHAASVPFFYGMTCDEPPESLFYNDAYMSTFVTRDTGLMIEKWWIHPTQGPPDLGANWIIQILRITVIDGQTHTDVTIGEAIDWDIPSDSARRNVSGFDASLSLVYQRGSEYDQDPQECQDNSDRCGGIALYKIAISDGSGGHTVLEDPYGAWTGSNSLWVYPEGGFVPNELDSLMNAREGYVLSDSLDADLHSVMTFVNDYTLTPTTTIWIKNCLVSSRIGYTAFLSAAQECRDYYDIYLTPPCLGCCIDIGGNVDYDPGDAVDISDLVYLVDYMFTGGPSPPCQGEANIDSIGGVDISDLVYLVDYMFTGGPPPPVCGCCK